MKKQYNKFDKINKILIGMMGICITLFIIIAVVISIGNTSDNRKAENAVIKENVTELEHRFTERYAKMANEFNDSESEAYNPESADFWYPREVAAMQAKKDGPGFYRVIIALEGEARIYYGLKLDSKTGDYKGLPIQVTAIDGSDVDTENAKPIFGNIETE